MKLIVILFGLCSFILGLKDTGTPSGLFAECPGMTKNTTLSAKTKKSLTAVALRPTNGWFGSTEATCQLSYQGAACMAKHLNFKRRKTLMFVSGYLDASFSPVVRAISAPYLERGNNVIILEIFPVLHRSYPIAARLTKPLGHLLGEFLAELTRRGLSPNKLELLGGSLGAHISYYAATRYHELTGYKPARLTALDPAGPCFRSLPPTTRLNPDAAHKVDAVHTNIDGFGLADPVGHVDFYVNGGVRCSSVSNVRHGQCYEERVETNVMGPNTNFSRPGIYYLPTSETHPFFLGHKGLRQRKYAANNYLLSLTPDEDIVI